MHGFPVIRIHPRGYDIIVYSPEFDLSVIGYLGWTRKALLILWIVLHYKLFPIARTCLENKRHYPSGYLSLAEQFEALPRTPYQYTVHKSQLTASDKSYERDDEDIASSHTELPVNL